MLSKFTHKIKIAHDRYAVFNNIIFKPVTLNTDEVNRLYAGDLDCFSAEEIDYLYQAGILVDNEQQDENAKQILIDSVNEQIGEKVNLLYIIPTNTCNLACKYCFIGKLNHQCPQVMTKETIDNTLSKFFEHLKNINAPKGSLLFYGGEPTLNFPLIKYTILKTEQESEIPIEFAIVTNGTALTDEVIDFFAEHKMNIGISLDGPKHITDENRIFFESGASVYDTVIPKIKKLQERNINFGLSVTISDTTLDDDTFLPWVKSLGIEAVNYNLMQFHNKDADWKTYIPKATKLLFESYDFLADTPTKDNRLARKIIAFHSPSFCYSDCAASGGQQLVVRPNGDLSVCHGYWNTPKEICGNINKDSFETIFKNKFYKDWAKNLTINKEKCWKCPAFYICGGGCPLEAEVLFGNKHKLDRPYCMYVKQVLKELLKRNAESSDVSHDKN